MRITENNRIVYVTADFSELDMYLRAAEDLHMKYVVTNESMLSGQARSLYPELMSNMHWHPYDKQMVVYKLVTDVAPI